MNKAREKDHDVSLIVKDIISDVAQNGDEALFRYNAKFDQNISTSLVFTDDETDGTISNFV